MYTSTSVWLGSKCQAVQWLFWQQTTSPAEPPPVGCTLVSHHQSTVDPQPGTPLGEDAEGPGSSLRDEYLQLWDGTRCQESFQTLGQRNTWRLPAGQAPARPHLTNQQGLQRSLSASGQCSPKGGGTARAPGEVGSLARVCMLSSPAWGQDPLPRASTAATREGAAL